MSLDNQHQYWDNVAHTKTFTHPVDITLFQNYVSKVGSIIDYGCGYGRVVSKLKDAGFKNVLGFDTSIELVKRGNQDPQLGLVYIEDHSAIPVDDHSADAILLFAVLTCIPSNNGQLALIGALERKLKPDGYLYISDYYLQEHSSEMARYEDLNGDRTNAGVFTLAEGATFRHHTREWITTLLANFRIVEEKIIEVATMNGHPAKAFQIIAQKNIST